MKWLFNEGRFPNFEGSKSETLSWTQKNNFKGKIGDNIIFYSYSKDKKEFTHLYKIESVTNEPKSFKNGNQFIEVNIDISLIESYAGKNFDDYIYSIYRIKYYDKLLYRHFNRRYYRLGEIEFEAIHKEEIFTSRTILGNAFNALHPEHRHAFSQYLVQTDPEILQNVYDYDKIVQLLIKYLQFAIISPSQQISSAYNLLLEVTGEFKEQNSIGFSLKDNEVQTSSNLLGTQVIQVAEHLASIESIQTIWKEYERNRKEKVFKKRFSDKGLPIDLKL
jgi:hypothetical protein